MATILGTPGPDTTLTGTGAADLISLFGGNDSINGNGGNDTIYGGTANDTLDGGANNDSVLGEDGDDSLLGGSGNDSLFGGNDNDILAGGTGSDSLSGGSGFDTANYSASNAAVSVNLTTGSGSGGHAAGDTLTGIEAVIGSAFNDTLIGSASADAFYGGAGTDSITGNDGDDTLVGGAGADTLVGGNGFDTADYTTSGAAVSINLSSGSNSGGDAAGDSLSGIEAIVGSALNDTIIGSNSADSLSGGGGADSIAGVGGNDTLAGGAGNDTVDGGFGNDQIDGGTNDDSLTDGAGLDTIFGGDGNDTIAAGDSNDSVDGGIGADSIDAGSGNDTVLGGLGNDSIAGGGGSDSLFGGDGNDTIYGDTVTTATATNEVLNWSLAGADEASIANGFVQDTGLMNVRVSFATTPLTTGITVESTDTVYIGTGEPMSTTSNLSLQGTGTGVTSTTYLDFEAATGSGLDDAVQNVQFRINDIDASTGNWQDVITINAYDSNGNLVPVTISLSGNDSVSGNTITAANTQDSASSALGSALINIAGPVARVEIVYANVGTSTQSLWVSNVHFTTIPQVGAADSIDGGIGDDLMYGGIGNDTLNGGAGADSMTGGQGSDLFTGITIGDVVDGSEDPGNTDVDVLDLFNSGWTKATTNIIYGGGNNEAGTVQFLNNLGNVIGTMTFSNIETIIPCFTPGTVIETLRGPVAVEEIVIGDRVLTRDSGYRPVRWIGRRDLTAGDLAAQPELRPVVIGADALGPGCPDRDMMVSPQHRMLLTGARAELVAGEPEVLAPALHLLGIPGVARARLSGGTSYLHIMFDAHEIVRADGAWCESFQPGDAVMGGLDAPQLAELVSLFPELATEDGRAGWQAARTTLRAHETRAILA